MTCSFRCMRSSPFGVENSSHHGYLTRERGIHRLAETTPKRPSWMAQEIPAWESLWLPRYLRGEITE